MKYLGLLIDINVIIITGYFVFASPNTSYKKVLAFAVVGLFVGTFIYVSNRTKKIEFPGGFKLETIVEEAKSDAKVIKRLKNEIESHKNHIDMIIRNANNADTQLKTIDEKTEIAKNNIAELNNEYHNLIENFNKLNELINLYTLSVQAKNFNRKAFDKLWEIVKNTPQSEENQIAHDTILQIVTDIDPILSVRMFPNVPYKSYGFDPQSASFDEFKLYFFARIHTPFHERFLHDLWENKRFSTYQKLEFMAEVIETSNNLRAIERACMFMEKEDDKKELGGNIVNYKNHLKWWEENKDRIKKKYESNQ